MLQPAGEKAQSYIQQSTQDQGMEEVGRWFVGGIRQPMLHRGAHHKEQNTDCGCPQRAFTAEKTVVDGAGDEADATVFQQHRAVMKLETVAHAVVGGQKKVSGYEN